MKKSTFYFTAVLSTILFLTSCKNDDTITPTDETLKFTKTTTTGTIFAPLFDHQMVVFNNKLWIIGGRKSDVLYSNEIWNSTDGASWTQATVSGSVFSVRTTYRWRIMDTSNCKWFCF